MQTIIILDFSTGKSYVKPYNTEGCFSDSEAEDFLAKEGLREEDCQWMIVDSLTVEISEELATLTNTYNGPTEITICHE